MSYGGGYGGPQPNQRVNVPPTAPAPQWQFNLGALANVDWSSLGLGRPGPAPPAPPQPNPYNLPGSTYSSLYGGVPQQSMAPPPYPVPSYSAPPIPQPSLDPIPSHRPPYYGNGNNDYARYDPERPHVTHDRGFGSSRGSDRDSRSTPSQRGHASNDRGIKRAASFPVPSSQPDKKPKARCCSPSLVPPIKLLLCSQFREKRSISNFISHFPALYSTPLALVWSFQRTLYSCSTSDSKTNTPRHQICSTDPGPGQTQPDSHQACCSCAPCEASDPSRYPHQDRGGEATH